jgi:putative spermidine/putrescine transport system permease protein
MINTYAERRRPSIVFIIAMSLVVTAPFVGFAFNAFSYRWFYPQLLPDTWTLRSWEKLFSTRSRLPEAFLTSLALASSVTLVSLFIALPAARALGLYRFRLKRLVEFVILAPVMVPPISVGMGLSVTFIRLGLGGTVLGVALVHLVPVLPYAILSLTGIFKNYSTAYEEQARSLGARPLRIFMRITLPAVYPGLVVAGLFSFLISWSQYILTMLVGGGRVITMPVLLFTLIPGGDNASIAATSLIFIIPSLAILALTSRFLTRKTSPLQGLGRL